MEPTTMSTAKTGVNPVMPNEANKLLKTWITPATRFISFSGSTNAMASDPKTTLDICATVHTTDVTTGTGALGATVINSIGSVATSVLIEVHVPTRTLKLFLSNANGVGLIAQEAADLTMSVAPQVLAGTFSTDQYVGATVFNSVRWREWHPVAPALL